MNEPNAQQTPRLTRDFMGYDLREHPLPLGAENWSQFQVVDAAGNADGMEPSFSGDDIAILLSVGRQPAEFINGMIRPISPDLLHDGKYYTLRSVNDYRFDWDAKRWFPA